MALAEDPYKALTLAKTPAEVKQAQDAIRIMKQASTKTKDSKTTAINTNLVITVTIYTMFQSGKFGESAMHTNLAKLHSINYTNTQYKTNLTTIFNPNLIPILHPQMQPSTHTPRFPTPNSRTQGFKPSGARGRGRGRGRGGATSTSRQPQAPQAPTTISLVDNDNDDEVDEECSTSEDDENLSDMAKIRKAVAKKTQQAGVHHEGEVVQLDQVIEEDAARYPEMEAAPELTMIDVMPAGKAPDTNPAMIVNM